MSQPARHRRADPASTGADLDVRRQHIATATNGKVGRAAETIVTRMGTCVGADRKRREWPFVERRIDEMLRLLRHRYGEALPEIDDEENELFFAVAHAVHAWFDQEADARAWLLEWLAGFAPWLADPPAIVSALLARLHPRKRHMTAQKLGALWRVTLKERTALNIVTISPGDISPAQFKRMRAASKRERDRLRAETKRREAKAIPRAESLSARRPWEAEGISRRTFERRRIALPKPDDADSSPLCEGAEPDRDANSSPLIENRIASDEFASGAAIDRAVPPPCRRPRDAKSEGRGQAPRPAPEDTILSQPSATDLSREICDDPAQPL